MLYEVLGDIWVVQRNPYLQDDLLDNPDRRKRWSRRCTTAWPRSKAPRPEADAQRDAAGGRAAGGGPRAVREFDRTFDEARAAPRVRRRWAAHAKDNIKFDGLSRVAT
jgi:hypothetical protein